MTETTDITVERFGGPSRSRCGVPGWWASLVVALYGLGLTIWSTVSLAMYGWTLFVGVPFAMGVLTTLFVAQPGDERVWRCIGWSLFNLFLVAMLMLTLGIEGVICLIMAAPICAIPATLGALVGYLFLYVFIGDKPRVFMRVLLLLLLPGLMVGESSLNRVPGVDSVTTTIDIAAPVDVVWSYVVEFEELAPPDEVLFRSGIAFPTGARIEGTGVGALRYCNFSTGSFVEPITVWDEPTLLRFDVTHSPEPMKELSWWDHVHPPHLHGFLQSRNGQFRLIELDDGGTRIVGTTWYEHGLYPDIYWRTISDFIVHRIHNRVLDHIKSLAEAEHSDLGHSVAGALPTSESIASEAIARMTPWQISTSVSQRLTPCSTAMPSMMR